MDHRWFTERLAPQQGKRQTGMVAIHAGCPLLGAPHMAAGHLTIPLAGAVVGYLTGRALPYLLPRPHNF